MLQMIEKHAAGQSASLADMQNELRSLKSLLQSRTAPPPPPPTSSSPQPAWQNGKSGSDSLASSTVSLPGSTSSPNLSSGVSSTTAAANALLTPKGRGIPAWQKAPSPSPGSASLNTSGNASTTGSGVAAMGGSNSPGSGGSADKGKGKESAEGVSAAS